MRQVTYIAAFTPEPEGGYSVTFPDAPGAITQGEDANEALENAREALELMLEAHDEAGDALPEPRALDIVAREITAAGAIPFAITASAPSKATRINITIDEGLLDRINREVDTRGQSRSAFFADAARRALRDAS